MPSATLGGPGRRSIPLLAATLLLTACAGGASSPSAPTSPSAPATAPGTASAASSPAASPTTTQVGLMLSYVPSVQFFPPLLAQGLGYFAQAGLDVDIQPSQGSSFVVQQVAAGNIATGLPASQSILLGYRQSPNFKVVYQFATQSFGIYVRDDSPIRTLADLKGHTAGTPDLNGGETLALRIALEQAGLSDGTDVKVEALGYNELGMAEALQDHRVDALSIYWSTSAIAQHAGIKVRCITCSPDSPSVGMGLIVASSFLAAHRDAVVALGRALAKATLFAQTNPDAAVAVLEKVDPAGGTDTGQLKDSMQVAIDAIAPQPGAPYGANDVSAWQALMDGMLKPGAQSGLDQPVDVSGLVDSDLVTAFNDFDHQAVTDQANSYQP